MAVFAEPRDSRRTTGRGRRASTRFSGRVRFRRNDRGRPDALRSRHEVIPIESDDEAYDRLRDARPDLVFNIAERLFGPNREVPHPDAVRDARPALHRLRSADARPLPRQVAGQGDPLLSQDPESRILGRRARRAAAGGDPPAGDRQAALSRDRARGSRTTRSSTRGTTSSPASGGHLDLPAAGHHRALPRRPGVHGRRPGQRSALRGPADRRDRPRPPARGRAADLFLRGQVDLGHARQSARDLQVPGPDPGRARRRRSRDLVRRDVPRPPDQGLVPRSTSGSTRTASRTSWRSIPCRGSCPNPKTTRACPRRRARRAIHTTNSFCAWSTKRWPATGSAARAGARGGEHGRGRAMTHEVKEKNILVGIAYNAYDPITSRKAERASEESVEQTAKEVLTAVTELGYTAFILPLHKSFMAFLNRLKDLNADVIINLCEAFAGYPAARIQRRRGVRAAGRGLHRERLPDAGPLPEQVQDQGRPQAVRPADRAGQARRFARREARHPVPGDRQAQPRGRQPGHPSRVRRPDAEGAARSRSSGSSRSTNSRPWSRPTSTAASSTSPSSTTASPKRCPFRRSTSPRCPRASRASSATRPSG